MKGHFKTTLLHFNAWQLRNLTIRLGDWSEKYLRASNSTPKYEHFPTLTSFQTAWVIASSSTTRNCSITEAFQRKNVELSSKMQFYSKQTRSIQNHAPKLKLRTFPFFQRHTWWRTTNAHACVISRPPWELACSKSNMADELVLFNVQHEEQGVVTQKICNIVIFTRAKRQGQTCICYSTRKIIHLQVFYGGKQIGKQRTLQRTLKHVLSLLKKIHLAQASPFSMKDWTKRVLKRRTVITGPSISQWNSFVKRTKVQS